MAAKRRLMATVDGGVVCETREEGEGNMRRCVLVIRRPRVQTGDDGEPQQLPAATGEDHKQDVNLTPRCLIVRMRRGADGGWRSTTEMKGPLQHRDNGVMEMMARRRLVLVLDLDHTLLHSTSIRHLSPQETYLLHDAHPVTAAGGEGRSSSSIITGTPTTDRLLFSMEGSAGRLTELRPFVYTFLHQASTMYHLYICTMADRTYAHEMAKILDPDGRYLVSDNIVSKSDYTERNKKGLDVVRLGDERTTIILDDTEDVWEKHLGNLIPMPAYHYFAHSRRRRGFTGKSLAELRQDEDESTGALAATLELLRQVHSRFFDPSTGCDHLATRDVRAILKA